MNEVNENIPALPFVIVIDRSASMKGNGGIELINDSLPRLVDTIKDNPDVEETASLGLMSFANTFEVHEPIKPLTKDFDLPTLEAYGKTSYAAPLNELRAMIERDLPCLARRGWRPIVFFITDGKPNFEDDRVWLEARDRLLDPGFRLRPTLVALGCGKVDRSYLERLASDPSLARWKGGPIEEALQSILRTVRNTIITITQDPGMRGYTPQGPDDIVAKIFEFNDFGTGADEIFGYQPA
jgi:uncharacterized protein YegL